MKYGLLVLMFLSNMAFAQLFRLNATCGGSFGGDASACAAFTAELENQVNDNFPEVDGIDELGDSMSNASAVATKGNLSSDYSNEIDIVQVGIGAGFGVDFADKSLSDGADEAGGFGIAPAIMVGLNPSFIPIDKIGPIEMDRLRLFGNFFSYNLEQDNEDATFEMGITSIGFRARYHLMDGAGVGSLMKWGGVHVTTGYQYYKLSLDAEATISDTATSGGGSADITGTATLTGDVSSHSIPIEVSTYAQLGYVFTFYGGLATDLTFGSGKFDLDVNTVVNNTTGAAAGYSANGVANQGGEGGPNALLFRAFAGLQLNVPIFKLYLQGQKTIGQNVYGANVGFKLNW